MQRLWTPWRFEYVTGAAEDVEGCVFCWAIEGGPEHDAERLVLHRARYNFVIINKYPYNNGHLMIAPYDHISNLAQSSGDVLAEMMLLAKECERILGDAYHPHGFNIGMNLGRVAGAGIEWHQHLHIVPRWTGDVSFMTSINETRLVPEMPDQTYERLRPAFQALET